MGNLDDSENNAKVSDSVYSRSCSNSQSRRSHSSKSTHSGSRSSKSSGYGGKPSIFSDNSGQPVGKRSKENEGKQKKLVRLEKTTEAEDEVTERPLEQSLVTPTYKKETYHVMQTPSPKQAEAEKVNVLSEKSTPKSPLSGNEEINRSNVQTESPNFPLSSSAICAVARAQPAPENGFSCVITMHDGVVMYTTPSLTATLGFPEDMWMGRSFIDFVHSRDQNIFASHITNGLSVPKDVNSTNNEVPSPQSSGCTMVCRIRKYRNLSSGYGVKENPVSFMPFNLKLSFKNISDEEGKVVYLVIEASPIFSAYKTPNELVVKPIPFVIRHAANGNVEYIDSEAVSYLGFLPQDLEGKDALQLYHVDDLPYLRQVYETIVREGAVPKTKPYRIMTQNWDFILVETEWSSFINPWSKKLEFVVGKHSIIQGPTNPDVFQAPKIFKFSKANNEEMKRGQSLRECIIRIMNEVLTKPAEAAKQRMTKKCQDLASFMESLIEENPNNPADEELKLEIQEPDSYCEREMLGGISPHHDYNDSTSSAESSLSYNQINYNETLQRYFDSHQAYSYEDYNTVDGENILGLQNLKSDKGKISSEAQTSKISGYTSSCESGTGSIVGETPSVRLTESMIKKHNAEMEKKLMKIQGQTRSSSKCERRKVVKENRQKKKEHLERCNASFQPTAACNNHIEKPRGVKRGSKYVDAKAGSHKHHCPTPRQSRKNLPTSTVTAMPPAAAITNAQASTATHWQGNSVNGMNAYIVGVGLPQHITIMNPMNGMPGMIPMYYAPAITSTSEINNLMPNNTNVQFQQTMPCVMYGQAVYGPPFMYTTMNPQMSYPQSAQTTPMNQPLGLAASNYEEACKQTVLQKQNDTNKDKWNKLALFPSGWESSIGARGAGLGRRKQLRSQVGRGSGGSIFSSSNTFSRSTDAMPDSASRDWKKGSADDNADRTDEESSYSSFYSSFFKTDTSGSADEFSDSKKMEKALGTTNTYYEPPNMKTIASRKTDPPWTEQVCVTSELVYKYQLISKNMDDVLKADKTKIDNIAQPPLVNYQLGQLYLDLQLEGVTSKLTLEEGITSSSSSGEESVASDKQRQRRKRDYNKLAIFYEEDAPFPPTPPTAPAIPPSRSSI